MDRQKEKRSRSHNFSMPERSLLIKLAISYKHILENKKTDGKTNRAKNIVWSQITREFNGQTTEHPRDNKVLRGKYESIKKELRKAPSLIPLTEEEKELMETIAQGGVSFQLPESDTDYIIHATDLETHHIEDAEDMIAEEVMETVWGDIPVPIERRSVDRSLSPFSTSPDRSSTQRLASSFPLSTSPFRASNQSEDPPTARPSCQNTRRSDRRRFLLKKRRRALTTIAEKKMKVLAMREETESIKREVAKANLIAAKLKIRAAEFEVEAAKMKRDRIASGETLTSFPY